MGLNQKELKEYLQAQIKSFNDWIWCFGIDTGLNLREYFSENELWEIWIHRHAKAFHDEYFKEKE